MKNPANLPSDPPASRPSGPCPSRSFVRASVLPSLTDIEREAERLITSVTVLRHQIEERTAESANNDEEEHYKLDQRLTERAIKGLRQVLSNFREESDGIDARLRQDAFPIFPTLLQPPLPFVPVLNGEEGTRGANSAASRLNGIRIADNILKDEDVDNEEENPGAAAVVSTSNIQQPKSKPKLILISPRKAAGPASRVASGVNRSPSKVKSSPPAAAAAPRSRSRVPVSSPEAGAIANVNVTPAIRIPVTVAAVPVTPITVQVSSVDESNNNHQQQRDNVNVGEDRVRFANLSESDEDLECLNALLPIERDVQKFFEQEEEMEREEGFSQNGAAEAATTESTAAAAVEPAVAPEPVPTATTSKAVPIVRMTVSVPLEPMPITSEATAAQTITPESQPKVPTPMPQDPDDPKLRPEAAYVRLDKFLRAIEDHLEVSGRGLCRGRVTVPDSSEGEGDGADDENNEGGGGSQSHSQSLLQPPLEDESEEARNQRLLKAAIRSLQNVNKAREKANDEARARAQAGTGATTTRRRRRQRIDALESDESGLDDESSGDEELLFGRRLSNANAIGLPPPAQAREESDEDMDLDFDPDGSVLDLRPSTGDSDSEEEARRLLLGLNKPKPNENNNNSSSDTEERGTGVNGNGKRKTAPKPNSIRKRARVRPLPALPRINLDLSGTSSSSEEETPASSRRYPKRRPPAPLSVSRSSSSDIADFLRKTKQPPQPRARVEIINTDNEDEDSDDASPSPKIAPLRSARRQIISSSDSSSESSIDSSSGEESTISDGSSGIEWITLGHAHEFPKPMPMTKKIKKEIRGLHDDDDDVVEVEVAVPTRKRCFSPIAGASGNTSSSSRTHVPPEIDLSQSPTKPTPARPAVAVAVVAPMPPASASKSSEAKPKGRRAILPIIPDEQLRTETKRAGLEEEARRKRTEERDRRVRELALELRPGLDFVLDPEPHDPVQVANGISRHLKDHQKEGVKFIWDACFESQPRALSTPGGGCILAHSMGLGKTLQIIAILHTILRNVALASRFKRVLVVCPKVVVRNWRDEIKLWQRDILSTETVPLFVLSKGEKLEKRDQAEQLRQWRAQGGIGLVHYELLDKLIPAEKNATNGKNSGAGSTSNRGNGNGNANSATTTEHAASTASTEPISPTEEDRALSALYEDCLRKPGPEVVVLDEGHRLKNRDTKKYKMISSIATERKIILTGTPLQNNLAEFYAMMSLIKPDLLGTFAEFSNRFINPIENGQFKDSLPEDVDRMRERVYVLTQLVAGCVHRRSANLLQQQLKPKLDYTIRVNLTPEQATLYNAYLSNRLRERAEAEKALVKGKGGHKKMWPAWHSMSKIIAHPRLLSRPNTKEQSEQRKRRKDRRARARAHGDTAAEEGLGTDDEHSNTSSEEQCCVESNWYCGIKNPAGFPVVNLKSYEVSAKLRVLRTILEICEGTGEKVLVFSQFLTTLDQIQDMLAEMDQEHDADLHALEETGQGPTRGRWRLGMEYMRLDGKSNQKHREMSIEALNAPDSRVKVFLLCTLACSLGINLIGANRVVVFDTSWNPANDLQAVHRVYRYGQQRTCYVYRLVAQHTVEEKVYNGQIIKLGLAQRVVDEKSTERTIAKKQETVNSLFELYPAQAHPPRPPLPTDPAVLSADRVLSKLEADHPTLIHSIREHKSYLQDDESLTEEQQRNAVARYEKDKNTRRVVTRAQANINAGGRGAAGGSSTSGSPAKGRQPRGGGGSGGGPGRPRKSQPQGAQQRNPIPTSIWKNAYYNLTQLHPTDTAKCLAAMNELEHRSRAVNLYYEKAKDLAQDPVTRRQAYDKFQETKQILQQRLEAINVHYNLNFIFPNFQIAFLNGN